MKTTKRVLPATVDTVLTGRRRYRLDTEEYDDDEDTPPLVLQVEVSEFVTGREDRPNAWVCRWRDATPEDVSKEELA